MWILGLSRVPVIVAYPMLSLGYVINAIAAYYLFGEAVSVTRWLGIGFIIVGVWLVAGATMRARATLALSQVRRPDLDEATIDGVAEVLRSGQLTSGPVGAALRSRAVERSAAAVRCAC